MTKNMPDQVLIEAMREIQAVLKKRDLAGMVMIASSSHTQFLIEAETSWTCVANVGTADGDQGIRIRAKREDPIAQAKLAKSVGLFLGWGDTLRDVLAQLDKLSIMLGQHIGFTHVSVKENPRNLPPL